MQVAYDNLLHIQRDDAVYDFLLGYWQRLKNESWQGWDTAADREHIGSPDPATGTVESKAYVFPRYKAAANDPVLVLLNGITACPDAYNRKVWIATSHLGMSRFTEFGMLDRIEQLSAMGCAVKFLAYEGTPASVRDALEAAGATVVTTGALHDKYVIVDATSRGPNGEAAAPREFVWTGSHNLYSASAWRDAEASVRIENHEMTRAYITNFDAIWDRHA